MRTLHILLLVAVAICPTLARDDTVTDRTSGKDVTEAVLRLISRSNIFPDDHSFLTRLAYVESRFGQNTNTFRTDYYGGIWQVEESVFRITQENHTSLVNLTRNIESQFKINWSRLTWRDLLKPLHSGLAAALYFARVQAPIPDLLANQANYWRTWYRPLGNVSFFISESESLKNQTRCRGKMDLCILLDGSGSINQFDPNNYQRAKNFTASIIESFTLDYTRIGMIVFSHNVTDIFPIQNNFNISTMSTLARNALYPSDGTMTDLGILRAVEMFKNITSNQGVPRVLTVFTDGQADRTANMTGAIQAIANNSIKSVSVGIGSGINQTQLLEIALNDRESVFTVTDFNALNDFLYTITSVTCEVPQRPTINSTVTDTLLQDEKRYYHLEIPPKGITITLSITTGRTNGYWSRTESVPSSALHDGMISGSLFIGGGSRQAEAQSVYVAVQGLETQNSYTIKTTEGNTSGANGVAATNTLLFVLLSVFSYLFFN